MTDCKVIPHRLHGFEIYLERATLVFESGAIHLSILTSDGKKEIPTLHGGDDPINAFTAEIQAAVQGVAAGKQSELLSGQLARDALVLCHKECESVRTGKIVTVS